MRFRWHSFRIVGLLALVLASGVFFAQPADAETYKGIFWNLESGDSNSRVLARQMAEKGGDIDFWGLSEVLKDSDQALDIFEDALEQATGVDYVTQLSEEGGGDRLAILFRSDRLTSVPYSGQFRVDNLSDNIFEVDEINVGGTIRPGLGVQLKAETGQQFIILVNHWKAFGGAQNIQRRRQQAIEMNAFAIETPLVPIFTGGDFNIPLSGSNTNSSDFLEVTRVFDYLETPPNIGTFRSGSVLDAVFETQDATGWIATTTVLNRSGDEVPASTRTFVDDNDETDHRPLLLTLETDIDGERQALRETIDDCETQLTQLRSTLDTLTD